MFAFAFPVHCTGTQPHYVALGRKKIFRGQWLLVSIIIIIITCFIRCWQNAAKYNHQVGLIHIKVDKTIHSLQMK